MSLTFAARVPALGGTPGSAERNRAPPPAHRAGALRQTFLATRALGQENITGTGFDRGSARPTVGGSPLPCRVRPIESTRPRRATARARRQAPGPACRRPGSAREKVCGQSARASPPAPAVHASSAKPAGLRHRNRTQHRNRRAAPYPAVQAAPAPRISRPLLLGRQPSIAARGRTPREYSWRYGTAERAWPVL